jgi:hypothetical protein
MDRACFNKNTTDPDKNRESSTQFARMTNLVFLLSLVLLCSGCKYFKKSPSSVETISADTVASDEMVDSSAYYSDAANVTTEPQTTAQYNAVNGKYYMIVGCFTVSTNADRYAEKLRGMGYESQIITGNGRFQMVAVRTYSSFRESVNELDKFRNEVTPNAWVYLQR